MQTTVQKTEDILAIKEVTRKEYLDALLPELPLPKSMGKDNAIEPRILYLVGGQDRGKTNDTLDIVNSVAELFGARNLFVQRALAEHFDLISTSKWERKSGQVIMVEDLTGVTIPKETLVDFFRYRHIMFERTGLREGLCLIIFCCHRLYETPLSFRSEYDGLHILSAPTNRWDRDFVESVVGEDGLQFLDNIDANGFCAICKISFNNREAAREHQTETGHNTKTRQRGPVLLVLRNTFLGMAMVPRIRACVVPIHDITPKDDLVAKNNKLQRQSPFREKVLLASILLTTILAFIFMTSSIPSFFGYEPLPRNVTLEIYGMYLLNAALSLSYIWTRLKNRS